MIELLRAHQESDDQPIEPSIVDTTTGKAKPEESTGEKYEVPSCRLCEDSGACDSCERGIQWKKDNPYPGSEKPKRKIKRRAIK